MESTGNQEIKPAGKIVPSSLDIGQIMALLPHRYPFLMIDRVLEIEDAQRILAVKNVSVNEPFFTGHFPGRPVMTGVMILEAMAQAAALLAHVSTNGVREGKTIFLVGANDFKWKRMVVPGDTLKIEVKSHKLTRPLWMMKAEATVEGKLVASGMLSAVESD